MPNGDPDFAETTLHEFEAFFAPISETCQQFAKQHNIKIVRYYHESPTWSFLFRHPAGGIAKIDLEKRSETTIGIWQYWWHDNYENATRSVRTKKHDPLSVHDAQIATELESALADVLSWESGHWDSVHSGYESWHSHWTKSEFEALEQDYPTLKR